MQTDRGRPHELRKMAYGVQLGSKSLRPIFSLKLASADSAITVPQQDFKIKNGAIEEIEVQQRTESDTDRPVTIIFGRLQTPCSPAVLFMPIVNLTHL